MSVSRRRRARALRAWLDAPVVPGSRLTNLGYVKSIVRLKAVEATLKRLVTGTKKSASIKVTIGQRRSP